MVKEETGVSSHGVTDEIDEIEIQAKDARGWSTGRGRWTIASCERFGDVLTVPGSSDTSRATQGHRSAEFHLNWRYRRLGVYPTKNESGMRVDGSWSQFRTGGGKCRQFSRHVASIELGRQSRFEDQGIATKRHQHTTFRYRLLQVDHLLLEVVQHEELKRIIRYR